MGLHIRRVTALTALGLAGAWLTIGARTRAQEHDLDRALDAMQEEQRAAAAAQHEVSELSDQSATLLQQLRATQQRTESVRAYNAQLAVLVEAQDEKLRDLQRQLEQVTVVGRDIVPLMLKMVDALDQLVALDMPFLLEERRQRLAGLRALMNDPQSSTAEKYRRVMEAYQIELDYGRTIEVYRGQLEQGGHKRTVDFLRFGRVALLYNTLDRREAGAWNKRTRRFEPLDERYLRTLPQAIRVAREQTAPDLIMLPIPSPEEGGQ